MADLKNIQNAIVIDGQIYEFVPEQNEKREMCQLCTLRDLCFTRLRAENMICRIHFNEEIKNGYYKLKEENS